MVKFRLELLCFKYSEEHEGITIAKETMELLSLEFCEKKTDRKALSDLVWDRVVY